MTWEMRGGCGPYYTRSRRVNGRIIREYVGKGYMGELASAMDEIDRTEQQAKAEALRTQIGQLDRIEEMVEAVYSTADEITVSSLESAGYHRHHRGEWRKRRRMEAEHGKQES
ncbi:MAG TPA: hypothetical protein VFI02_19210 [Armatimonadota bacterium]|nr:hypothetical protein [Armatimonadota bacterium]